MRLDRMLICLIALVVGSQVFAQDYEIRLTRPAKVGLKYETVISVTRATQKITKSQGEIKEKYSSSFTTTFEGTITVLKVDKLQRASELRLLVSKCLEKMGAFGTLEEVLTKGTQVVARRNDSGMEFLVDGKAVSKGVGGVLEQLFSLPRSQVTADSIYGTKDRKKVGDSWAINSAESAKDASSVGTQVDKKNISGSTRLKNVIEYQGKKCLQISTTVEGVNFTPPLLPDGMAVEKSKITFSYLNIYPIDKSIGSLAFTGTLFMSLEAKSKTDQGDTMSKTLMVFTMIQRKYLK